MSETPSKPILEVIKEARPTGDERLDDRLARLEARVEASIAAGEMEKLSLGGDVLTVFRLQNNRYGELQRELHAVREQNRDVWQRLQTIEAIIRRMEATWNSFKPILEFLSKVPILRRKG